MHAYNTHHLCARTAGGQNVPENMRRMKIRIHEAVHTVFGVALPNEQLQIVMDLNSSVFTHQFKEDVARILLINDPEYIYRRGVLIPKK